MNHPNEIPWPARPFYIRSRAYHQSPYLVIRDSNIVLGPGPDAVLWQAKPDERGCASIGDIRSNQVISRVNQMILPLEMTAGAHGQLWRLERIDGSWCCINCLEDWEQKINILGYNPNLIGTYHWDRGAANELWMLEVENGSCAVDSVVFDVAAATIELNLPATPLGSLIVHNTSNETLHKEIELSGKSHKMRSIQPLSVNPESCNYGRVLGLTGGIDASFEVSEAGSLTRVHSQLIPITSQDPHSEMIDHQVSTAIEVPAGKKYDFILCAHYGKAQVPFTANIAFHSSVPGIPSRNWAATGMLVCMNNTRTEIKITDITSPNKDDHSTVRVGKR